MLDDVLQIRMPMVCCYAVKLGGSVYLVDTGFVGGIGAIERALDQEAWRDLPVKGIVLTHGHLDHTLNAAAIASKYDVWVAAPRADHSLIEGNFSCEGYGRVGALMQQSAASILKYRMPDKMIWYQKGAGCDFLEAFEVVALPGHTDGHSGFLFGRYLFCGDAFASFGILAHLPPRIFNNDTEQAKTSLRAVAEMDIDGIFPCHCDKASPEMHLERLRGKANKM